MLGKTGFLKNGFGVACMVVQIDLDNKKIKVAIPTSTGNRFVFVDPEDFSLPEDYRSYLENLTFDKVEKENVVLEAGKSRDGVFSNPTIAKNNGSFT